MHGVVPEQETERGIVGGGSTNAWAFFVLGPIWALTYFTLFRVVIQRFDLKTPGRDLDDETEAAPAAASNDV